MNQRVSRTVQQIGGKAVWIMATLSIAAFLIAMAVATAAKIEPLRPDTASYLYFDPSRSIGYPIFLWLIRTITGQVALAVPMQMALLTAALFVLGLSFYRLTGRPCLSIAFQAVALISPEMWLSASSLVTEAVATAFVAMWCAQLLRVLRTPDVRGIALLCLAALAATLVRPSLIVLFAATLMPCIAMLQSGARWRGVACVAASFILSLVATPVANFLIHGSPASGSPVARGLLQHSMYCPLPAAPANPDALLVEQTAAPVRYYIDSAPADIRGVLKQLYSGELRFGFFIPALGRRHGFEAGWQTDPIIDQIARERIAANPRCYAGSALRSYYRMATYKTTGARGEISHIKTFLAEHPPVEVPAAQLLPREEELAAKAAREIGSSKPARPGQRLFNPPKQKNLALMIAARLVYTTVAIATLLALALIPFRSRIRPDWRPFVVAGAALGVAYHGMLAITALVELPLMRYTVPVWPVVCLVAGLLASCALAWLSARAVNGPRSA